MFGLRISSLLLIAFVLVECGGELSWRSVRRNYPRSRVDKGSPARVVGRGYSVRSPVSGKSWRTFPDIEAGVGIVEKELGMDDKFWEETEEGPSPEGEIGAEGEEEGGGKLPIIVQHQDPYKHHAGALGKPLFAKKKLFRMMLFSAVTMILVVSTKLIGVYILVVSSAAFGFFTILTTTALFGSMAS